jgi:hypothetical protein
MYISPKFYLFTNRCTLHNKPKAAVHPGQKLTGPKEEEGKKNW